MFVCGKRERKKELTWSSRRHRQMKGHREWMNEWMTPDISLIKTVFLNMTSVYLYNLHYSLHLSVLNMAWVSSSYTQHCILCECVWERKYKRVRETEREQKMCVCVCELEREIRKSKKECEHHKPHINPATHNKHNKKQVHPKPSIQVIIL